ncbi:MauE/DoxX family redox-associated membrane protein [Nonomuraea sp. NPDC049152]|uniref:MauE/DoxX family redox-associated membrane protein n=1 Tax=Nonomuraea sp. NPDC049152 TaxID=3154350 RepID=UPI0033E00E94
MHDIAAIALALFLVVVGTSHFVFPAYFRTLVPAWFPWAGPAVAGSGVAEIVVGVVLVVPGGRAAGGWAAAALITAYLASHLDALRHARPDRPRLLDRPIGVAARLVVNAAYIGWAVMVALTAP